MTPPPVELLEGRTASSARSPRLWRWVAACALAEAVGLMAAAGGSRAVSTWAVEPGVRGSLGLALLLIVGAGLVEGVALGSAQGWFLGRLLPRLRRTRFVAITAAVAGLGWAAGSAPAVLDHEQPTGGAGDPPLALLLLGAVGIGLAMGLLLGLAQALVLRPAVRHVASWVVASTLAWPVVMAVIFVGASRPGVDWSIWAVLATGAATGALAGGVLGLMTHWALRSMTGVPAWDRVLLRLLASSWGWLDDDLIGLEVRGLRSGRTFRVPVRYAVDLEGALVVVPREGTRWWRNVHRPTTAVEVLWQGSWLPARAEPLPPGHPDHDEARATYALTWPHSRPSAQRLLVRVRPSAGNAG